MSRNVYLIEAYRFGHSVKDLAADHGVSRSWIYELISRYKQHGKAGLELGSRRPLSNPNAYSQHVIDLIVSIHKKLSGQGLDAGPVTIGWHLNQKGLEKVPSKSTIWRILKQNGLITPQPQKRPKRSYIRFESDLPNETWQSDVTHIPLANGTEVEIINIIDDHSRLNIASVAVPVCKGQHVIDTFKTAFNNYGLPQSVLTDNGAVYTARHRGGESGFERLLKEHDIGYKNGRPYKPTTQGKVERFHQTQKQFLAKQNCGTIQELQGKLDWFRNYYNTQRPHRARNMTTPTQAYEQRVKAYPIKNTDTNTYRIRKDRVDKTGKVTLRYKNILMKLGVGRKQKKEAVVIHQHNNTAKVYNKHTGEHISTHQLNHTQNYQPNQKPTKIPKNKSPL